MAFLVEERLAHTGHPHGARDDARSENKNEGTTSGSENDSQLPAPSDRPLPTPAATQNPQKIEESGEVPSIEPIDPLPVPAALAERSGPGFGLGPGEWMFVLVLVGPILLYGVRQQLGLKRRRPQ